MGLIAGLDIGIASVGWCVLDTDKERILGLGVRTFPAAENPKTGDSLARPRRLARSARRRTRRRAERMARLRELLSKRGFGSPAEVDEFFVIRAGDPTPYELRAAGLERELDAREWARVLSQLCKRRGYKSMRLTTEKDADEGAVKAAIAANRELMSSRGYRTAGEMLESDERFAESKRNKGDYKGVIERGLLLDEVKVLFDHQRAMGNPHADEDFERAYVETLSFQEPIIEGEELKKRAGICGVDRMNPRAPKACPSFERFRLLDKVANIRISQEPGAAAQQLSLEERRVLKKKAYSRVTPLTYADVRKTLKLPEEARFIGVRYGAAGADAEKKERLPHPHNWHAIRKAVEGADSATWSRLASNDALLDDVASVLTYFKLHDSITAELRRLDCLPDVVIEALSTLPPFAGNAHLSRETLEIILPHMEAGLGFSDACAAAGLNHSQRPEGEKLAQVPPIPYEDVRNPVVMRAFAQSRKVLNAILREFGPLEELHVELSRDVGKPRAERLRIEREQRKNRDATDAAVSELRDSHGVTDPRGGDVTKYKLWREQGGRCVYSGAYIDPTRMLSGEAGVAEIDHVLPHSRSFDNGYMNKVLATASANQRKRGKTPFEYLGSDTAAWSEFEARVHSMGLPRPKRDRLLKRDFGERAADEFRERNLNDTRYVARLFANHVEGTLRFDGDSRRPVVTVNGRATAYLRDAWRLQKVRADGDLHHTLDAAVVAATSRSMIQTVSRFFSVKPLRNREGLYVDQRTGEIVDAKHVPEPWEGFAGQLAARLALRLPDDPEALDGLPAEERPILVSRMPSRTIRGEVHEETIRRIEGQTPDGRTLSSKRVRVQDLTLAKLEKMVSKGSDHALYEALRARLEAHGGEGSKAFAEPLHKPSRPGRPAPQVKHVRLFDDPASGGVKVRGGIANHGKMVRTDVFERNGRYYLVPVYLSDVAARRLPNRAIVGGKGESHWREMDDSYRFKFSLHANDLVRLAKRSTSEAGSETWFGYFRGTNRSTASVTIEAHDGSWTKSSLGVAIGVIGFEKLEPDVLGLRVGKIRREKRHGFSLRGDKQPD